MVLVFLFLLGAILGSFLNVCIYRLPQHERLWDALRGLWHPPSQCPRCGEPIRPRDNLPVLGWLVLRGRCRHCRGRISVRYPLIELANGLLFVLLYRLEVPGWPYRFEDSVVYSTLWWQWHQSLADPYALSPRLILHLRYAYHLVLLEALIVATFIDIDWRIIPDSITLPAMCVGLLGGFALGVVHLVPVWFFDPHLVRDFLLVLPENWRGWATGPPIPAWCAAHPHWHGLAVSAAGLLVGGGLVWGVRLLGHWILRREAMGFGDVTLMAAIGSFIGWQPVVVVFFLAPVAALFVVVVSRAFSWHREIPYGPYLSLATLALLVGWKSVWPIAERIFGLGPILFVLVPVMAGFFVLSLLLVQALKWMAGVSLYPEQTWVEEWTSADQLHHFAGETIDPEHSAWRRPQWPGLFAARGRLFEQQWRGDGRLTEPKPLRSGQRSGLRLPQNESGR